MDEDDSGPPPEEVTYRKPPESILKQYEEATPHVLALQQNLEDEQASKALDAINEHIRHFMADAMSDNTEWTIDILYFKHQYQAVYDFHNSLRQNPHDVSRQIELDGLKTAMDLYLETRYLPKTWAIPSAEDIKAFENASAKPPAGAPEAAKVGEVPLTQLIDYPWHSLSWGKFTILGFQRLGEKGSKLLVEVNENGKYILELRGASYVGKSSAKAYSQAYNPLNLSEKKNWTAKHRHLYGGVAFVGFTGKHGLRAPATCCGAYMGGKLEVMTRSTLQRVAGKNEADQDIEQYCKQVGRKPPWDFRISNSIESIFSNKGGNNNMEERILNVERLVAERGAPSSDNFEDRMTRLERMMAEMINALKEKGPDGTGKA